MLKLSTSVSRYERVTVVFIRVIYLRLRTCAFLDITRSKSTHCVRGDEKEIVTLNEIPSVPRSK